MLLKEAVDFFLGNRKFALHKDKRHGDDRVPSPQRKQQNLGNGNK
jgi:hypothetical protein